MRRLEFGTAFSVDDGGPIDEQHKILFALINELAAAIEAREIAKCREVSGRFVDAARAHFEWEEDFLTTVGFPHVADHAIYHEKLLGLAEEARRACDSHASAFDYEACFEHLVTVFVDDVVRGDLTFKSFLMERGAMGKAVS